MASEFKIKKIIANLYNLRDYFKRCTLEDGSELITDNGVSDFATIFRETNPDLGFIMTPGGYKSAMCYRTDSGGEVYSNPKWTPDVNKFNLSAFGLKKNSIYKLTVSGRSTGDNFLVTRDRSLLVTNSENESLIKEDLRNVSVNKEYHAVFKANSNEMIFYFSIGKIYIRNISLDEIELEGNENSENLLNGEDLNINDSFSFEKIQVSAFGIFNTTLNNSNTRYNMLTKCSGRGLNLYLDKHTNSYTLERDNREHVLEDSFTNINYIININLNKLENKDYFMNYRITEVSSEISPNTLKPGYIRFEFFDKNGLVVPYKNVDGKIYIWINKLV